MSSRAPRSRRTHAVRVALTAAAVLLLAAALAGAVRAGVRTLGAPEARSLTTTGPVPPSPSSWPPARAAPSRRPARRSSRVPVYRWRDGCAPTSTGMVLGYWDGHGFPRPRPGRREHGHPRRLPDDRLARHAPGLRGTTRTTPCPRTTAARMSSPTRARRRPATSTPATRVADFMHTSWSVDGLAVRLELDRTWSGRRSSPTRSSGSRGVTAAYTDHLLRRPARGRSPSRVLQQEIDAGRPLVLCVDCNGDGRTDHAVAGIGYRETSGYPEYACWDTWSRSIRWQRFRGVSEQLSSGASAARRPSR